LNINLDSEIKLEVYYEYCYNIAGKVIRSNSFKNTARSFLVSYQSIYIF
jgi:hypothetical protein